MAEVLGLRELGGEDDDRELVADGAPSGPASDEDGEGRSGLEAKAAGPGRRGRQWAAMAIVALLAVGVAATVLAGGPGPSAGPPPPTTPVRLTVTIDQAVEASLDAWARFAGTGDLAVLAESFDPAGPQYERLRAEAPALASRPAVGSVFTVEIGSVMAGRDADEQIVSADVVLARPGEADQHFAWDLVMRHLPASERWVLWTVRERTGGAP